MWRGHYTRVGRGFNSAAEAPILRGMEQFGRDRAGRRPHRRDRRRPGWQGPRRAARGRAGRRVPASSTGSSWTPTPSRTTWSSRRRARRCWSTRSAWTCWPAAELDFTDELMGSYFAVTQPERQVGLRLRDQLLGGLTGFRQNSLAFLAKTPIFRQSALFAVGLCVPKTATRSHPVLSHRKVIRSARCGSPSPSE